MNRDTPAKVLRRRPMLLGYIACIVTIELVWKIAEAAGWIH